MKKFFISYYAVITFSIFLIRNVFLSNLFIHGILYQILMILFYYFNYFFISKFKSKIKWKNTILVLSFLFLIFSKDFFQFLFLISNMLTIMVNDFSENKLTKKITFIFGVLSILLLTLIFCCPFLILIFIFSLVFNTNGKDIYEDMHYYCDNHVEIYSYSSGAMDKYHYSIGKYYDFLDIDGIIYLSYHERNEKTRLEYDTYLMNHRCKLVGE